MENSVWDCWKQRCVSKHPENFGLKVTAKPSARSDTGRHLASSTVPFSPPITCLEKASEPRFRWESRAGWPRDKGGRNLGL